MTTICYQINNQGFIEKSLPRSGNHTLATVPPVVKERPPTPKMPAPEELPNLNINKLIQLKIRTLIENIPFLGKKPELYPKKNVR